MRTVKRFCIMCCDTHEHAIPKKSYEFYGKNDVLVFKAMCLNCGYDSTISIKKSDLFDHELQERGSYGE